MSSKIQIQKLRMNGDASSSRSYNAIQSYDENTENADAATPKSHSSRFTYILNSLPTDLISRCNQREGQATFAQYRGVSIRSDNDDEEVVARIYACTCIGCLADFGDKSDYFNINQTLYQTAPEYNGPDQVLFRPLSSLTRTDVAIAIDRLNRLRRDWTIEVGADYDGAISIIISSNSDDDNAPTFILHRIDGGVRVDVVVQDHYQVIPLPGNIEYAIDLIRYFVYRTPRDDNIIALSEYSENGHNGSAATGES